MHPAAIMTPKTAAASSSSTTFVLGSRLCNTAYTKRRDQDQSPPREFHGELLL